MYKFEKIIIMRKFMEACQIIDDGRYGKSSAGKWSCEPEK